MQEHEKVFNHGVYPEDIAKAERLTFMEGVKMVAGAIGILAVMYGMTLILGALR